MLYEFIALNRDAIIGRCRAKVAARVIPPPSETEINHGVPLFLDQLLDSLRSGSASTRQIDKSAGQHGHDLLLRGFTISQVVHDYGDVCQAITELAVETNAPINTDDFRTLNRCIDDAIAGAVTTFAREDLQHASLLQRRETAQSNDRVGFLVHELRNLVNTAIVAFEVLKTGNVGVSGSTGTVLNGSLLGLRDLVAHSLDEVRMTTGVVKSTRIAISEFIEEIAVAAALAAAARDVTFVVGPVEEGLAVAANQQVLAAVVGNLLQNAFKFTKPHSTVTLRVTGSADRLLIEVEDECGGLPEADPNAPFAAFEQRGADRSGLGIGLAFSRWGADAIGGRLSARNLPGTGCVFTVDLPLFPVAATAIV
ncbi:MAG: HAMP domain-containing sensor histidine kinase [Vicinamibacterales bacterium]